MIYKQVYYKTFYFDTNKALDISVPAEVTFINTGYCNLEINGMLLQPLAYEFTGTNNQPSKWEIKNHQGEIIQQEFRVKFVPTDFQKITDKQLTVICKYYR